MTELQNLFRAECEVCHDIIDDAVSMTVRYSIPTSHGGPNDPDGRIGDFYVSQYRLTRSEVERGGIDTIQEWGHVILQDVANRTNAPPAVLTRIELYRHRSRRNQSRSITLQPGEDWRGPWQEALNARLRAQILAMPLGTLSLRGYANDFSQEEFEAREKADARAKQLFIDVVGKDAFDQLANGGLLITGSEGGQYALYAKMTYCVTRLSDKARMCAVVPGVPMWDHLLGIKLTIEHDEPYFVRTANVTAGDYMRERSQLMRDMLDTARLSGRRPQFRVFDDVVHSQAEDPLRWD